MPIKLTQNVSNYIIGLILFVEAKNIGIDISNKETTSQHLNNFLTDFEELYILQYPQFEVICFQKKFFLIHYYNHL